MTGFSADWLAMREPFDHAARRAAAASFDLPALASRLRADSPALTVVDLACGTGANFRELAPRLRGSQRWLLVDHDPLLLSTLPGVLGAWARVHGFGIEATGGGLCIEGVDWSAEVQPLRIDLAGALDAVPFAKAHLVTASALLDLVSIEWLDALIGHLKSANAAALFALTVDGRVAWDPGIEGDEEVHGFFMSHQRGAKGFGPAMGAEAARLSAERFTAAGFNVAQRTSDWCIEGANGEAAAMVTAMVDGMNDAAIEQAPAAHALVSKWRAQRMRLTGRSRLTVGHLDLLAIP